MKQRIPRKLKKKVKSTEHYKNFVFSLKALAEAINKIKTPKFTVGGIIHNGEELILPKRS